MDKTSGGDPMHRKIALLALAGCLDKAGKVLLVEDGAFDSARAMFKKIKAKLK